jgi:hypothetical protein
MTNVARSYHLPGLETCQIIVRPDKMFSQEATTCLNQLLKLCMTLPVWWSRMGQLIYINIRRFWLQDLHTNTFFFTRISQYLTSPHTHLKNSIIATTWKHESARRSRFLDQDRFRLGAVYVTGPLIQFI